jgi:ABC-2 type transport system ATP-binding protein
MTAREYLQYFADLFQVRRPVERIKTLLEKVGLAPFADKRFREFSHGMLQKLSIVRALLHDPDILFLDEPISGLDPVGIKSVRDLILAENREGRTIFISSHQLSEMEKICHRVAIIDHGTLKAEDSMENILSRISREREVRVELETIPPDLPAQLKSLSFVRGCSVSGTTLAVAVSREGDFRRALSEHLIRRGLVPLRIEEKAASLEEAFITITGENVDEFRRGGAS